MSFQTTIRNTVASTSNPVMIEDYLPVTVTVIPGMGSAKVQYSTSSRAAVSNGTASWLDWPHGMVSLPRTDAVMVPIMALRLVSSADAILEVMAKEVA